MKNLLKVAGIFSLLMWGALAFAQTEGTAGATFPIVELGNCESREACKLYCDEATHKDACFAYAKKVGLMSSEKIEAAKKILSKKGPGGCNSKDSCKAYCADSAHAEECLTFAESHKIITTEKVDLIKRVVQGEAPGACKSPQTCKMYCSDPAHRDECRAFAEANGLGRPRAGSSTPPGVFIREGVASSTLRAKELRAGSTTAPFKNLPPRMGSSTLEGKPPAAGVMRQNMGSTTRPEGINKPQLQRPAPPSGTVKPLQQPVPPEQNDGLGAAVLKAFLHLLGL
jgi:hypothetical protein